MIKLIDILKEIIYKPDKKIGSGLTGDTYSVKGYPNYVYKPITKTTFGNIITKEDILNIQKFTKNHPDVFAQIIEIGDDYYIQEKLNTKLFKQDLKNLDKELKKKGKYYYEWYAEDNDDGTPETRALYFSMNVFKMGDEYKDIDNELFSFLSENNKELTLKINKFFEQYNNFNFDAHGNNFGYDVNGNIKYFDLT